MALWSCCPSVLMMVVVMAPYCLTAHRPVLKRHRWLEKKSGNSIDADQETREPGCSHLVDKEATEWIFKVDGVLGTFQHKLTTASWNYLTNLTDSNAKALERIQGTVDNWLAAMLPTAQRFLGAPNRICNSTTRRLLGRFVNSKTVPVANDPETRKRINSLMTSLEELFSTAVVHDADGKEFRLDPELSDIMTNSRDYDQLLWAWEAWHNATGPIMKSQFVELVDGMNEGARDNGFADAGIFWQEVDFEDPTIERKMDTLYHELKPLYQQLHAYVRRKLRAAYPNHGIDASGPIPAHLFGDMWAQQWSGIADLLTPFPGVQSVNVTAALQKAKFTVHDMFQTAEEFYTSLGLEPMTNDFWLKSVLVRPSDGREIACHGSADDFFTQTDFRETLDPLKRLQLIDTTMSIMHIREMSAFVVFTWMKINELDFDTVHHEMGHVEYFMQYRNQPTLFRDGANAAFHEAIGDTISLSVMTTKHLETIGLIPSSTTSSSDSDGYEEDINFLLKQSLFKVVFIPYAYVMDKWRYRVFRGDTQPHGYNIDWYRMRLRYQGISAPVKRPVEFFDAASKYHIPANVPGSRYFFSFIGQFQFHSALCKLAGHSGPLHKCDIYRSTEAGNRLKSVLSLGGSLPWSEAMQIFTHQREFRVDAMKEYFKPLFDWLKKENEGFPVGW